MKSNFIKIWFSYACQQLDGVSNACLFISDQASGSFSLKESSSEEFSQSKYVHDNVQAVVMRRKSVVTTVSAKQLNEKKSSVVNDKSATVSDIKSKNYLVTAPLIINKQIIGAVCFEFKHDHQSQLPDYLGKVESAVVWLSCLPQMKSGMDPGDAEFALKITAAALSQSQSTEAAMAVASELTSILMCERVSIGFVENHDIRLHTISNSTHLETRQNIVKCIEAAMQESIDQRETIVFPPESDSYYNTQEHDALVRQYSGAYVCTVPLVVSEEVIGAVMFERQEETGKFDEKTNELCEQLAGLFAPILYYRRLNDRPITEKIKESTHSFFSNFFGSEYQGTKLFFTLTVCVFVLAFFLPWEYKVSANAILEGAIERVITSPEGGYIKDASARPGDLVEAGETLATLDDRDLQLEKLKWTGKHKQVSKEYRESLAEHNLTQIGILRAQLSQADAQLEILELKLNRTVITTPISAVIVSGDYTRALGSPVERGQVLYKVSPLDDYRVVLKVDESEVSAIVLGMQGELTLSAAAEDTFAMEIIKITPVSTAENGVNYFQVEAKLLSTPEFLRPGMQGIGKIEIGKRQLLWIWTHKMVDWIKLKLWSWW
ncbi:MAG: HlyD family efflux transporter periplasmic adaptor subunit [Gammaproteobacteria bacterium]|nr:HlyD family efflux transporter periplasmic adaptor subunit [Gammaproteobacteria bacterium]